jgi:hypothetical protein
MQLDTFLHVQTPKGRSLGFSALMSQISDSTNRYDRQGHLCCWLNTTTCNKKDKHFNKKIARAQLREKAQEKVRVRDLPLIFAALEVRCSREMVESGKYNFVLRKFV